MEEILMFQFSRYARYTLITLVALTFLVYAQGGWGHGGHHGFGHFNPDSLTIVTVSGTALVDTTFMHAIYFLDEDGDGQADYHLNFGPPWYQPDSGNASRPNNGDAITITGGLRDSTAMGMPSIIVTEINGEYWRDLNQPFWHHPWGGGGHHHWGHMHHAFGWLFDSLQTVNLNGVALVDSTMAFDMYFMDTDYDSLPDYFLNFGPPWYEPPSGATRPSDGDTISIVGGLLENPLMDMVIVYEINGQVWRDTTQFGHHFGGQWIHHFMNQAQRIQAPFDPEDWMEIHPGWYSPHHGGMMQFTMYMQMLQIFPQNAPNTDNTHAFAAYEIGAITPLGTNLFNIQGHLTFNNNVNFQLHYNDIQLLGYNIDESTIQVKYWDEQSNSWVEVPNAQVNTETNTVTFATNEVSNYLILTGDQATGIHPPEAELKANGFYLEQNYPNPFNPTTTIRFTLSHNAPVVLTVYNVLGQKVVTLLHQTMNAGTHQIQFDGRDLPSGTYFYELNVDGKSRVRMMNLMK